MEKYYFIAHDIENSSARQCACWIAGRLGEVAVMPQRTWAPGYWRQHLEYVVNRAERIIVVLTPGFLISAEPFVEHLRKLVLQESLVPEQKQNNLSRLLVVLAGDCVSLLQDESVFYCVQDWVDFRTVLNAEEAGQQLLLDYLCPARDLAQTTRTT